MTVTRVYRLVYSPRRHEFDACKCGSSKTTSPTFLSGVLLLQLYSSLILKVPSFRLFKTLSPRFSRLAAIVAGTQSRAHFPLFWMSFSCFSALLCLTSLLQLILPPPRSFRRPSSPWICYTDSCQASTSAQSAPGNAPLVHLQLRPCQP